ncbi:MULTISPECIES: hypothetical protein [Paenibacillus]|uniref:Uncharacterized protein n=1 Tax=Paenibacillus azoreducens TaxID=116718 RepID=A0A919YG32_9BACL|nr:MULTISPECIES: hypothetical protein [Paenibacillus]MBE9914672.1 hypothetical protein [Paenibacillus donghaensis]GIO48530.1 hypothetical protein J34TS1_32950 [Paenibacillus azoreducens]
MKNPTAFTILLILNILYGLTLLLYPFMLIIVAFSFDDPAASKNLLVYAYTLILISYPLGPLLSYLCWLFYNRFSFKWAYVTANLPLIWILAFSTCFFFIK